MERKGFWREPDGTPTTRALAFEAWVLEAHGILQDAAQQYHGVVRDDHLAEWVQERSGIRTSRPQRQWMPQLLAPVIAISEHNEEPPLVALVVTEKDGRVGVWFDEVRRVRGFGPIEAPLERERYAARARLECYQWAGVAPDDGGEPAPVGTPRRTRAPRAASTAATSRRAAAPKEPKPGRVAATDRPVNVCPHCFMAIPATGLCDNCD